jgi:hypothetical protein
VLFASKNSQKAQLFKSALSELCKSSWAARFLTRREVEKALLKATILPYKTAKRIIASAFETASGTQKAPTTVENPPQYKQNLNSKLKDTNYSVPEKY